MTALVDRMAAVVADPAFARLSKREAKVLLVLASGIRDGAGRSSVATPVIAQQSGVPERWVPAAIRGLERHGLVRTVRRPSGRASRCVIVAPGVQAETDRSARIEHRARVSLSRTDSPTALELDEQDDGNAPGIRRRAWPHDDGFEGRAAACVEAAVGRPAVPGLLLMHLGRFAEEGGTLEGLRALLGAVQSHTNPAGMLATWLSSRGHWKAVLAGQASTERSASA